MSFESTVKKVQKAYFADATVDASGYANFGVTVNMCILEYFTGDVKKRAADSKNVYRKKPPGGGFPVISSALSAGSSAYRSAPRP